MVVCGGQDRADVNKGLLQYFIVRQLGGGWYVNSAPSITVDWQLRVQVQFLFPTSLFGGKKSGGA